MAEANFRLPPALDLTDGNIAENFKKWKRQMDVYLLASGATTKEKNVQTAIILHCAGPQMLEVFEHFDFVRPEDKEDPEIVLRKIEEYCTPRQNEVLQTYRFWNVQYMEPFDSFLTELRSRADSCRFQEKERMIRDKIVFTVTGKLQELLLRETQLTLNKTIDICRAFEMSSKQAKEMNTLNHKVNKLSMGAGPPIGDSGAHGNTLNVTETRPKRRSMAETAYSGAPSQKKECKFCGRHHEFDRNKCPAWGKVCSRCHGRNHFKVKCKRTVRAVQEYDAGNTPSGSDTDDDTDVKWLYAVQSNKPCRATALMQVNGCDVRFQLDSGADVNTISHQYVKKEQVHKSSQKLIMWNKTKLKPLGVANLKVTNPRNNQSRCVTFTVIQNGFTCLLGIKTIQDMGLVTINDNNFISRVESEQMGELGDLGMATLTTDPDVPPRLLPCRRIPLALQNDVSVEIHRLVERGILVPVEDPTDWVSQMAVVRKPNGKIRICIDPQPLNTALKREHYKLPTLDDVLPKFHNAKVFSKLDVKEAFWHVKLDDRSSRLTTMITPFGRFRWTRLPFGLKVSSEIFQKRLNNALGDLNGVICVTDDITVVGCGNTQSEAEQNHATNLANLQRRCEQQNIRLNKEKAAINQKQITFMGHQITENGVKADHQKIKAIVDMPPPTDVHGVKRFCGMIQYMAKFVPHLSDDLEPIRQLTRKDVEWNWSTVCERTFKHVKDKLTHAPVLAYFDPENELTLQVDSSKDGLGAALLQNGRPIEYASRALTPAERNWAQIEKETLAVVFGLEHFDQYTFGRRVVVENDHKPLESILKKPLSQAPRRLQALLMRLYRYDVEFKYKEGKLLVIADTLSRAFVQSDEQSTVRIMNVNVFGEIPDKRLNEVRQATRTDQTLQKLLKVLANGWPNHKSDVEPEIKPYFDIRDMMSFEDGIVLKGEQIVIPKSLRTEMKSRLHSAHLGYDSMMRRARIAIYWPGISQEIKTLAESCDICQELKPKNQKESLKQHYEGSSPWEKIGLDLFQLKGHDYLVLVDYDSGFIEVDSLRTTTSSQVIHVIKKHCARYGIPKCIVSDGGPQFTASEFRKFTNSWCIQHEVSSPGHQQANGRAEAAVKVMKNLLLKAMRDNKDMYLALLELRNTPRMSTGCSPAQMMFGRQTRSMIPTVSKSSSHDRAVVRKRKEHKRTVKRFYDKTAKDMRSLKPGQPVTFQHPQTSGWHKGVVKQRHSERSYIIGGGGGTVYRRNRVHIRERHASPGESETHDNSPETLLDIIDHEPTRSDDSNTEAPPVQLENSVRPQRTRREPSWLKDYVRD